MTTVTYLVSFVTNKRSAFFSLKHKHVNTWSVFTCFYNNNITVQSEFCKCSLSTSLHVQVDPWDQADQEDPAHIQQIHKKVQRGMIRGEKQQEILLLLLSGVFLLSCYARCSHPVLQDPQVPLVQGNRFHPADRIRNILS